MSNPFIYLKEQCETCKGKGYIWHNDPKDPKYGQKPEQCICVKKMVIYNRMQEANIPPEYFDLSMSYFKPSTDQGALVKKDMMEATADIAKYFRVGKNFLFFGPNGTGKTMLAIEMLKAAARSNYSVHYAFYPVIVEDYMKKGYKSDEIKEKMDELFASVDFLVLDEIGKEAVSAGVELTSNILEMHILKKRFHKKTILISNKTPTQLCGDYNSTVASLLTNNYIYYNVDGVDYRYRGNA